MSEHRARSLLQRIEAMTAEACDLDAIEVFINSRPELNEEQRAALWLYAWAIQPGHAAAREAQETVLMLA